MSAPSPFAVGQAIGTNMSRSFERSRDESTIDSILSNAMQTESPEELQRSIGLILSKVSPERQGPAMQYIQGMYENIQSKKQKALHDEAARSAGVSPNLPPALQAQQFKENAKAQRIKDANLDGTFQASPTGLGIPLQALEGAAPNKTGLQAMSDDQLVKLTGHPDKEVSVPVKGEIERRKGEKKQKEVYQIYKDAGLSDEEALRRSQTDSPATARTVYREKTQRPLFESEGEKLEAKRVAELATEIEKNYSTAKGEDIRLERMQTLSNEGNVSTPLMITTLEKIGLPIGVLSNPATDEYKKLETDFIRDARDIFPGGRITNYEIQSYLKTIPTLFNSKEGRDTIIRNRKLLNEAKKVRYEEYKNILKENGGKKPANLGIMLEERTADKIIDIEDRFKQGIDETLDKHSQKLKMYGQDGRVYEIPSHLIPQAQQQGLIFK